MTTSDARHVAHHRRVTCPERVCVPLPPTYIEQKTMDPKSFIYRLYRAKESRESMNDPAPTRTETKDAHLIATWVRVIRPDWDTAGVIAALRKRADTNPARLALAALACAADRTNRYPNVIAMDGAHWRIGEVGTPADRHPSSVPVAALCLSCGRPEAEHPSIRCETWERHVQTATPEAAQDAYQAAKDGIDQARAAKIERDAARARIRQGVTA